MSTISIANTVSAPALRAASVDSTRLRMTARGRRVLAALAAAPIVLAIAIGAISGGSAVATRDAVSTDDAFVTVTVAAGDTLWGLAESFAGAGAGDTRDVIAEIQRVNRLESTTLVAGQTISIPASFVAAE